MMRVDHELIKNLIEPKTRILDLGCGDGNLLKELKKIGCSCQGIEIDKKLIKKAVTKNVNIICDDLDNSIKNYGTNSFDYVIINETLQVVKNSLGVLKEALRVGKTVIVGFPNFARWKIRYNFFFSGLLPKNPALPYEWYNTPNLRVITIKDFINTCKNNKIKILKKTFYINQNKQNKKLVRFHPNFFATNAILVLKK